MFGKIKQVQDQGSRIKIKWLNKIKGLNIRSSQAKIKL